MILSTKSSAHHSSHDLHDRVARYGKAKANSERVVSYLASILDQDEYLYGVVNPLIERIYERMRRCASWLVFREYVELDATQLRSANFCGKHLLCQGCAIRRGARLLQSYMPRIEHLVRQGLVPWMVTFTVRNGPDLLERYLHLEASLKRLLAMRKNYLSGTRGYSPTEMAKIRGGVYAFECPRSRDGNEWHPHVHMLALCESSSPPDVGWVDPDSGDGHGLRAEWLRLTGDSYQVDVRRYSGQGLMDMVTEVMKYAVKFSSQSPADTWHAFQVLHHRRLIRSFGVLYGLKIPSDDMPLAGPYIDHIYTYLGGGQYGHLADIDMRDHYEIPLSIRG